MKKALPLPDRTRPWLLFAVLTALCALCYLIRVRELTYFKDDWYYIYDASILGPSVFREMFSIDRPARGLFFEAYYGAFGPNALPYHLSAFAWRIAAVGAAFWLLQLLWPGKVHRAFVTSALFALYPGYLWWVSAIEYQPMIASLALGLLSVAASVKAALAGRSAARGLWLATALLTGWAYLWLVDYAIGMEVFRILCLLLVLGRKAPLHHPRELLAQSWHALWVSLFVPIGFLGWRLLFFENVRKATDIGLQLGQLVASPASTGFRWSLQWFQSVMNVGLLAWVVPFNDHLYELRLRDIATALALAAVIACVVVAAARLARDTADPREPQMGQADQPRLDVFWLGLLGTAFGVLPIVLANRSVTFALSHYALPASLPGVLIAVAVLERIDSRRLELWSLALLTALASATHYAVLVRAIIEERAIENFWWQVTWRAPGIDAGTTMVVHYPIAGIGDDGFGVMEAPNLIYYSDARTNELGQVHYALSAVAPSDSNVRQVLVGRLFQSTDYRSHAVDFDYGEVLVISQPTEDSCVHVLDGPRPILSAHETGNVVLIAPKSRAEKVLAGDKAAIPPEFAFGQEPVHSWCFYFETADLAAQHGDWQRVSEIAAEVQRLQLLPADHVEWMPFLEAYAALGDLAAVKDVSTRINIDSFVRVQACLTLTRPGGVHEQLSPEMRAFVAERFCRNVSPQ
jgi:hypothetical protein